MNNKNKNININNNSNNNKNNNKTAVMLKYELIPQGEVFLNNNIFVSS